MGVLKSKVDVIIPVCHGDKKYWYNSPHWESTDCLSEYKVWMIKN